MKSWSATIIVSEDLRAQKYLGYFKIMFLIPIVINKKQLGVYINYISFLRIYIKIPNYFI